MLAVRADDNAACAQYICMHFRLKLRKLKLKTIAITFEGRPNVFSVQNVAMLEATSDTSRASCSDFLDNCVSGYALVPSN